MNPQTKNPQTTEPTLASTWQAVVGSPLNDQFLEWPADLFAVTNVLLERSEAYRFALSPSNGLEWPPRRFPNWSEAVEEAGRQWSVWVEDRQGPLPGLLAEEWSRAASKYGPLVCIQKKLRIVVTFSPRTSLFVKDNFILPGSRECRCHP